MKKVNKILSVVIAIVLLVSTLVPSFVYAKTNVASTQITAFSDKKVTSVKVKWKKVKSVSGYQIMYSANDNFKANKTVSAKSNQTSKTVSKLKSNRKYYFKVRAYKKTNKKTIYSKWSAVKSTNTAKKTNSIDIYNAYLKKINSEWKNIVKENPDDSITFSYCPTYMIYDIDGDGVKDLIIKIGTNESNTNYKFYTYDNGLKNLGDIKLGHSAIFVPENQNGLYLKYGHMDVSSLYLLTLKNNKINKETVYENENYEYAENYNSTILDEYHASKSDKLFELLGINSKTYNLKNELTSYYWVAEKTTSDYGIHFYEFTSDGKVKEYWGDISKPKTNWIEGSETIKYTLNNNKLTLKVQGENWNYNVNLNYTSKDGEYGFYQTGKSKYEPNCLLKWVVK